MITNFKLFESKGTGFKNINREIEKIFDEYNIDDEKFDYTIQYVNSNDFKVNEYLEATTMNDHLYNKYRKDLVWDIIIIKFNYNNKWLDYYIGIATNIINANNYKERGDDEFYLLKEWGIIEEFNSLEKSIKELLTLLMTEDFEIFEKIEYGTPEYWNNELLGACEFGNFEWIKKAIRYGANINCKDKLDWTPLIYSIFAGNTKIIDYLIENGADINIDILKWIKDDVIVKCLIKHILKKEPYNAYKYIEYLSDEQREKYKEFITLDRDFDIFEGNFFSRTLDLMYKDQIKVLRLFNKIKKQFDYNNFDYKGSYDNDWGVAYLDYIYLINNYELRSVNHRNSVIYLNGNIMNISEDLSDEIYKFLQSKQHQKIHMETELNAKKDEFRKIN